MRDSLNGKRVLVTGGSRGIGAAVARAFGLAGATVTIHYHQSSTAARIVAEDIRASGETAYVVAGDFTVVSQVQDAIGRAVELMGGIDVLINNAGDLLERRSIAEIDQQYVDQQFFLNSRSVVFASREAAKYMRQVGEGAIVNTTSIAQYTGGGGNSTIYAASKGFLASLTKGFAKELAPFNIRVNAVAPGVIETDLHKRVTDQDTMRSFIARTPLGRLGNPQDCVGAYLFLADTALSGFITGQTIDVDGGIRIG